MRKHRLSRLHYYFDESALNPGDFHRILNTSLRITCQNIGNYKLGSYKPFIAKPFKHKGMAGNERCYDGDMVMIEPPKDHKLSIEEEKQRKAVAAAPDEEIELADIKKNKAAQDLPEDAAELDSDLPTKQSASQKIAKAKLSKGARRGVLLSSILFSILGLAIGLALFYSGVIAVGYVVLLALGPLAVFPILYGLFKGFGKVLGFFEALFDKIKKNKGLTAAFILGIAAALILTLAFPALGLLFAPGMVGLIALGAIAGIIPFLLYFLAKNPRAVVALLGVATLAAAIALPLIFAPQFAAIALSLGLPALVLPAVIFAVGAIFLLGALYAMFNNKRDGKARPLWQRTALVLLGVGIIAGAAILLAGLLVPGLALGAIFMGGVGGLVIMSGLAVFGPLIAFGVLAGLAKMAAAIKKNPGILAGVVGALCLAAAIIFPLFFPALVGSLPFLLPLAIAGGLLLLGSLAHSLFTKKWADRSRAEKIAVLLLVGILIAVPLIAFAAPAGILGLAMFGPIIFAPMLLYGLVSGIRAAANAIAKRVQQMAKAVRNAFAVVCFLAAVAVPLLAFIYLTPLLAAVGFPLVAALPIVGLVGLLGFGFFALLGRGAASFKLKTSHKIALLVGLGAVLAIGFAPLGLGIAALVGIAALPLALGALSVIVPKVYKFLAGVANAIRKNPKTAATITVGLLMTAAVMSTLLVAFPAALGAGPLLLVAVGTFVVSALMTAIVANRKGIAKFFSNIWQGIKNLFGAKDKPGQTAAKEQEATLTKVQDNTADNEDTLRTGVQQTNGSYLQPDGKTQVFHLADYGDDFFTAARRQEHGVQQTDGSYLQADGTRTIFLAQDEALEDYMAEPSLTEADAPVPPVTDRKNLKTAATITVGLLMTAVVMSTLLVAFPAALGAGSLLLVAMGTFIASSLVTAIVANRKEVANFFSNIWQGIEKLFGAKDEPEQTATKEQEATLTEVQDNTADNEDTLRTGVQQTNGSYLQPDGKTQVFHLADYGDDFFTAARREEHGVQQTDGSYLQADGTHTIFLAQDEALEDYMAEPSPTEADAPVSSVADMQMEEPGASILEEEASAAPQPSLSSAAEVALATHSDTAHEQPESSPAAELTEVSSTALEDERPEGVSVEALAAAKLKLAAELEKKEVKEGLLQGEIKLEASVVKAIENVSPKPAPAPGPTPGPAPAPASTPVAQEKKGPEKIDYKKFVAQPRTAEERKAAAKILVEEGFKQSPLPISPPSWVKEACVRAAQKALEEMEEARRLAELAAGTGSASGSAPVPTPTPG
jgi:uncharacterized membrane protein